MTLTPRERVIAQIHHQETDPLPYDLGFETGVPERLDAYYGTKAWRALVDNAIVHLPDPGLGVDTLVRPEMVDAYGARWRTDRRPFHLVEPPLKEPDLAGYSFPDLNRHLTPEWMASIADRARHHADHFTVATLSFGLFERSWVLRGFMEALMDAAGNPEFYDELTQQIADHQLAIVERLVELPVDGVMFSDDWGYQTGVLLGPERWRRFIKPHLARMYACVHAANKYTLSHCCGSIRDIMPDVIEIGLDVLQSVQAEAAGMNPYDLKAHYGSQITFWGGLGSQSTVPFGTPQEIRQEIQRLSAEMGMGGGYILGPSKSVQPETPNENAAAVLEGFLAQAGIQWP